MSTATEQPRDVEQEAPPVGEEIHLPGPSFIPVACAFGIMLIVVGTTIDWLWTAIGAAIFIVTVVMWIRDNNRDIAALPEEHVHH